MTKHNLLTDAFVRSKNKAPGYHLDGQGLYLQVTQGGSASWVFKYTLHKRVREMGLGSADVFGLATARALRQRYRVQVKSNIDPLDFLQSEKDAAVQAKLEQARKSKTFEDCAREYHAAHAHNWKNAKHGDQWINTLTTYIFPKFGKTEVEAVSKQHIVDALSPLWTKKAETASRLLQRIRLTLNFAAAKDYCSGRDGEFWEQVRIALGPNDRAKNVTHHDSCPYPQASRVLQAVKDGPSSDVVKLAFEFAVITAARSGEVRGATWSEMEAASSFWIVPGTRMKAGREHRVPLSTRARAILAEARLLEGSGATAGTAATAATGLIFPSGKGKPLSDMVFTQLLRRMELTHTLHGFRATFRTWGTETTQYPFEMLELALAHVVGDQTVRAYARSDMVEQRRQLMQDWADFLVPSTTA